MPCGFYAWDSAGNGKALKIMEEEKGNEISRREFLKVSGMLGAGAVLLSVFPLKACSTSPSPSARSAVVHVHGAAATSWDYGSGYYGNYVEQSVVDSMVNQGVQRLTGASSVAAAWNAIVPSYAPGRAIAIKVNFNNCGGCSDSHLNIDGLIHPVNSVIAGLKQIGVVEQDIWIYDASRNIPSRFIGMCPFPSVRFIGKWASGCASGTTFVRSDADAAVKFSPPAGTPMPAGQRIADVLIDASYLINIPIMKAHAAAVTLGFKNHFGTISDCASLHDYIYGGSLYSSSYNPLVDIYLNPHISTKTVLTIGDGLFGNWLNNYSKPQPWIVYGGKAPNSLFFGRDPVSIDSVMTDYLALETQQHGSALPVMADDYLVLAEAEGLGVRERGDPTGSGYRKFEYIKFDV